jgi:starch synthase
MASKQKILFASAEVVPFAKTGGLADVAGALPKVLAQMGHDVRIVMPRYGSIDGEKFGLREVVAPFTIPHGREQIEISVEQSDAIEGVPTYFIRNDYLYNRDSLYGQPDDDHRFVAYDRGMLEMLDPLGWRPDVIHCNDWHTGLVPVFLKTTYADLYGDIGSLFTIHNLAYQGTFSPHIMELAGLPWELFTWDQLAFWDHFNFMKAGLMYADKINTVSPTYAKETCTEEFGEGLEGVLAFRKDDYAGILNGIDYEEWNPERDPYIAAKFSADNLEGKTKCKHALQKAMSLPQWKDAPVLGVISRLSYQKGLDILDEVLPDLLENHRLQVVILGTGEEQYHDLLTRLALRYPEKLAIALKFDNALAHQIYAGSDFFLMPSRYEPCGLGQLISMAYGTVPIVRATGGLADSVKEFKSIRSTGNGFVFEGLEPRDFAAAIERGLKCFTDKPECWDRVVQNAFASDFSWQASAKKYAKVYKDAQAKAKTNYQQPQAA